MLNKELFYLAIIQQLKAFTRKGDNVDRFEIKEEFLLNGQSFKILSGAIHYFRVDPSDWHHSLYNLKALGFNTVETYVPWNLHEPQKEHFILREY